MGIYIITTQLNHYDFKFIALFYVIYNVIAFGLQPFLGYFADQKNLYSIYILIGLTLPLIALQMIQFGVIAIILATFGNAMYHLGGGVLSINLYPNKAAPAGFFVAPGALGVFVGVLLAKENQSYVSYISLIVIIMLLSLYFVLKTHRSIYAYRTISDDFIKIICLILAVVLIRGLIGTMLILMWKNQIWLLVSLTIGIFSGKLLGGWLGDVFGYKRIGIGGLIISLPLLILGHQIAFYGILGAFFFNLTMAITLFIIIQSLGKYKGTAFGLTTLSLLIAYLPSAFGLHFEFGIFYELFIIICVLLGAYLLNKAISLYLKTIKGV